MAFSPCRHFLSALSLLLLPIAASAADPAPAPEANAFFEKKIRPLLVEHCQSCHGGDKTRGGLKVTSRAALLQGGDTGPAIVPGNPEKSRLIEALAHTTDLKMPPKGKLSAQQIADLTVWVKGGAVWPEAGATVVKPEGALFTAQQRAFWAFQPMHEPTLPAVKDAAWPISPIDRFVLARLEAKGLRPAPPADKRILLRRATYDLTGLPPTPEEISAFLADDRPDAFARVVDRLLATPAYGERWGRHWLDVARYADSNGLDENTAFANAFRYRDYVIDAFNRDKPYNLFVMEQIAGDLLPRDADERINQDRLIATAFLALGPKILAEPDKQKMVMDIVDEQIDVTGKVFLGLTISCARCHDHKFDPIPTRDYYGLAGIFKSTKTMATLNTVAQVNEKALGDAKAFETAKANHNVRVKEKEKELKDAKEEADKNRLKKELEELKKQAPPLPAKAIAVEEDPKPANVKIHLRGNHLTLGVEAPRQFPQILAGEKQTPITSGSGRLELARWLTRPENPLTARVMVNRIWLHHFGEGLVRSPDNFGRLGDLPSHPELLDWLALRFVEDGWSLKAMHRRMLLSRTYQMASTHNAAAAMADPDNRLLWRFNRRRIEVEAMRDAMLAISGKLDRTMGGTLLSTKDFGYVTNDQSGNAAQYSAPRRSIYLPVIRNAVFDVFQVFDFVEPSVETGKRDNTVVAPQALFLLNGDFVREQAQAFALSLLSVKDLDDAGRVRQAYSRTFGREATDVEIKRAVDFVSRYSDKLTKEADAGKRRQAAWQAFCQVLFAANEFMYLK